MNSFKLLSFASLLLSLLLCSSLVFGDDNNDGCCERLSSRVGEVVRVDYSDATGDALQGTLVLPRTFNRRKSQPALILVHTFMGIAKLEHDEASFYAQKGYVVFLADIYGKAAYTSPRFNASNTTDIQRAFDFQRAYIADRSAVQTRIEGAVNKVKSIEGVDPERVAIAGYCFGGLVAMEAVRSGKPLAKAYISYHGILTIGAGTVLGNNGNLTHQHALVLHGRDDPVTNADGLLAFQNQFNQAGVVYQYHLFSQTAHSFMDPNIKTVVDNFPLFQTNLAARFYNPYAARLSRAFTLDFLELRLGCLDK